MPNGDLQSAWEYHRLTNHSPASVAADRRRLDWANEPRGFKLYPTLSPLALPTEWPSSTMPALEALGAGEPPGGRERIPTLAEVATLLHHAAGITRWLRFAHGEMAFRAAACTGALYHVDLYLVCGDLPGLAAGVYHYGPQDEGLRAIRSGDFRGALVEASGGHAWVAAAPACLVATTTYWRNAWKYAERAYRHAFWDSGTLLANTLAVAAAHGLPAGIVAGFVDRSVNRLLDLEPTREVALELVPFGSTTAAPSPAPTVAPLGLRTVPYSAAEVGYQAIRSIHAASALPSADDVRSWRGAAERAAGPVATGTAEEIALPEAMAGPATPIEAVIRRRGSARRFRQTPMTQAALATLLRSAGRPYAADYLPTGGPLTTAFVVANAVRGLEPGAYHYEARSATLERLWAGETGSMAGHLALDQELGADAAANVYFMADLARVLEALGNRGYRAAQLDGGVRGGRVYLAAYAQGLAATGLTFYDEKVTRFFGPAAAGLSPMFLVAVGERAPRQG